MKKKVGKYNKAANIFIVVIRNGRFHQKLTFESLLTQADTIPCLPQTVLSESQWF